MKNLCFRRRREASHTSSILLVQLVVLLLPIAASSSSLPSQGGSYYQQNVQSSMYRNPYLQQQQQQYQQQQQEQEQQHYQHQQQQPELKRQYHQQPQIFDPPAKGSEPNTLPPGWSEHVDPASGMSYYYNSNDGTTTWSRPANANAASIEDDSSRINSSVDAGSAVVADLGANSVEHSNNDSSAAHHYNPWLESTATDKKSLTDHTQNEELNPRLSREMHGKLDEGSSTTGSESQQSQSEFRYASSTTYNQEELLMNNPLYASQNTSEHKSSVEGPPSEIPEDDNNNDPVNAKEQIQSGDLDIPNQPMWGIPQPQRQQQQPPPHYQQQWQKPSQPRTAVGYQSSAATDNQENRDSYGSFQSQDYVGGDVVNDLRQEPPRRIQGVPNLQGQTIGMQTQQRQYTPQPQLQFSRDQNEGLTEKEPTSTLIQQRHDKGPESYRPSSSSGDFPASSLPSRLHEESLHSYQTSNAQRGPFVSHDQANQQQWQVRQHQYPPQQYPNQQQQNYQQQQQNYQQHQQQQNYQQQRSIPGQGQAFRAPPQTRPLPADGKPPTSYQQVHRQDHPHYQWKGSPYGQYNLPQSSYERQYSGSYSRYDQQPIRDGIASNQIVESSTSSVKEALGRTWQGLLGFGNRTKEVVDTARSTVVASALGASQTLSTTGSSLWGQAKNTFGSVFEASPSEEESQQYSLSGRYGSGQQLQGYGNPQQHPQYYDGYALQQQQGQSLHQGYLNSQNRYVPPRGQGSSEGQTQPPPQQAGRPIPPRYIPPQPRSDPPYPYQPGRSQPYDPRQRQLPPFQNQVNRSPSDSFLTSPSQRGPSPQEERSHINRYPPQLLPNDRFQRDKLEHAEHQQVPIPPQQQQQQQQQRPQSKPSDSTIDPWQHPGLLDGF